METPLQLSREAIDEFKLIYEKEFGDEISDHKAREMGLALLRLLTLLLTPN
jgi:hypothetical protein